MGRGTSEIEIEKELHGNLLLCFWDGEIYTHIPQYTDVKNTTDGRITVIVSLRNNRGAKAATKMVLSCAAPQL